LKFKVVLHIGQLITIAVAKQIVLHLPIGSDFIFKDNDKELAGHETKDQLSADVHFAHPYHSWERSLNENTNGMIRQDFSKR